MLLFFCLFVSGELRNKHRCGLIDTQSSEILYPQPKLVSMKCFYYKYQINVDNKNLKNIVYTWGQQKQPACIPQAKLSFNSLRQRWFYCLLGMVALLRCLLSAAGVVLNYVKGCPNRHNIIQRRWMALKLGCSSYLLIYYNNFKCRVHNLCRQVSKCCNQSSII